MSNHDYGPAFPTPQERRVDGEIVRWGTDGMSLRDWFAGHALSGLMSRDIQATRDDIAIECYRVADAMLAARQYREPT